MLFSFLIISYRFHFRWKNVKVKVMEPFTDLFRPFSSLCLRISIICITWSDTQWSNHHYCKIGLLWLEPWGWKPQLCSCKDIHLPPQSTGKLCLQHSWYWDSSLQCLSYYFWLSTSLFWIGFWGQRKAADCNRQEVIWFQLAGSIRL